MAAISCSKCNTMTERAGYPTWAIVVSICFFPVGLLSLLAASRRLAPIADLPGTPDPLMASRFSS